MATNGRQISFVRTSWTKRTSVVRFVRLVWTNLRFVQLVWTKLRFVRLVWTKLRFVQLVLTNEICRPFVATHFRFGPSPLD
jgi:hypothetical protein